mgnify:CR=1 FL=1
MCIRDRTEGDSDGSHRNHRADPDVSLKLKSRPDFLVGFDETSQTRFKTDAQIGGIGEQRHLGFQAGDHHVDKRKSDNDDEKKQPHSLKNPNR